MHSRFVHDFAMLPDKVALFGGSFDPVQKAHITVAEQALLFRKLGAVVFIPARQNPLKAMSTRAGAEHRCAMLKLALDDKKMFWISTIELEREDEEPSYTVDTLHSIRQALRPEQELHLIIGSDNLASFSKWKDISKIFSICHSIITVNREKNSTPRFHDLPGLTREQQDHLEAHFVAIPSIPISSTDIRRDLQAGKPTSEFLDPEVERYILEHSLYS